jgi:hypothetical protein
MRYFLILFLILGSLMVASAKDGYPEGFMPLDDEQFMSDEN